MAPWHSPVSASADPHQTPPHAAFAARLAAQQRSAKPTSWVFVPYDQLHASLGALSAAKRSQDVGMVMVENAWQARRRPYHKQKLALMWANMRHFALEQAAAGVPVRYLFADAPFAEVLAQLLKSMGKLTCMTPGEHELRQDIAKTVTFTPYTGWLSTPEDFVQAGTGPYRMDPFYRHMRKKTGLLMDGPQPQGGRWSLDHDNRQARPSFAASAAHLHLR